MRKIVFAAILTISLGGVALAASPTAEPARTAGDIKGKVTICSLLDIERVVAYIPGRSLMLVTAVDGSFEFNFVPPGTYQIIFTDGAGETVSTLSNVTVDAKQATDLGNVSICIDADGDGFDAISDCNDSNASINPDASEICNLIDDDCDELVDEGYSTYRYYRDADLDGYGDPINWVERCMKPAGYANNDDDCYDANTNAFPGASSYWPGSRGDGSFDYDCNNIEQKRWFGVSYCSVSSANGGSCIVEGGGFWSGTSSQIGTEPDCGESAGQFIGCVEEWGGPFNLELTCRRNSILQAQQCK